MLRVAVSKVHSVSPSDVRIVAQQLCNGYPHCLAKRRQMRTGKWLSDATLRVIRASPSPVQNSAPASAPPRTPRHVNYRRNHSHTQQHGEREGAGREATSSSVNQPAHFFQKPTNQVGSSGSFTFEFDGAVRIIVAVLSFGAFHGCCDPRGFFLAQIRG